MGIRKRKGDSNSRMAAGPKTDGFFKVHIKQAKASFSELWQRPLGNILTLAVISMALAMPSCLYLIGKNIALAASKVSNSAQVVCI